MKKVVCAALCTGAAISAAASGHSFYAAEGAGLGKELPAPLKIGVSTGNGIGKCGENIVFTVDPVDIPAGAEKIRISRRIDSVIQGYEDFPVKKFTVVMSLDRPGHLSVHGVYVDASGKVLVPPPDSCAYGNGVFIEPEKLSFARHEPADFDRFWAEQLKLLAAVPMDVKRERKRNCETWYGDEVEITSIAGIPVTGCLRIPVNARPGTLPAVVSFHGAGFKRASFRSDYGNNVIVFDVNAHGLNNHMPKEYYRQLNENPPAELDIFSSRDNAGNSYFKNMFLRTVRALDFIKSLPEWDGKTLIVHGRSQGGAQAIAAAALVPEVTLCAANVPALADHGGVFAGRKPGWPGINPEKNAAIAAASDYVDVANLAARIRCETLLSIGMIDTICPPVSVYLVYKNIRAEKHVTFFPAMGHNAPPVLLDGRERIRKEVNK